MWCKKCGQDVPGVVADGTSEYRCPRCRGLLRQCEHRLRIDGGDERQPVENAADKDMAAAETTPPYDGWELEQRLLHIERMLGAEGCSASANAEKPDTVLRFDSAHASHTKPHDRPRSVKLPRHGKLSSTIVWSTLLVGVTTLACGSVLIGWSMLSSREDLWSIGLPIGLAGGISLFVALTVQLDRLMNNSCDTAAKLDMIDNQLHRLADATNQLGTHHHSPSDAFYSHLAGGANPQLLLSDLKSQLDMLAVKISDRETG